jgi:pimeloyl-ACP methyl ester carboxylesterase
MVLGFDKETLETPDGVSLAVFSHTPPSWDAARHPTLFLSNGLGGNLVTWKHLVEHHRATHRIITWDYRGLYDSTFTPALKDRYRRGELDVDLPVHARDAITVLDHLGVDRAVFFGWSMGVQLNFELARTEQARMAGLIQICGAAGKAIATTVFGKAGLAMIPAAMDGFKLAASRFGPTIARMMGSPLALQLAKGLGVVAPSLDTDLAREVVGSYMSQDFEVYNRILMSLAAHDASDVLSSTHVPTLVIAGTRDPMTPMALSQQIVATLPDGELVTLEGGSHYVPVEFPDRLNELVGRFLSERVRAR